MGSSKAANWSSGICMNAPMSTPAMRNAASEKSGPSIQGIGVCRSVHA